MNSMQQANEGNPAKAGQCGRSRSFNQWGSEKAGGRRAAHGWKHDQSSTLIIFGANWQFSLCLNTEWKKRACIFLLEPLWLQESEAEIQTDETLGTIHNYEDDQTLTMPSTNTLALSDTQKQKQKMNKSPFTFSLPLLPFRQCNTSFLIAALKVLVLSIFDQLSPMRIVFKQQQPTKVYSTKDACANVLFKAAWFNCFLLQLPVLGIFSIQSIFI